LSLALVLLEIWISDDAAMAWDVLLVLDEDGKDDACLQDETQPQGKRRGD
jgi:hypothetical protein